MFKCHWVLLAVIAVATGILGAGAIVASTEINRLTATDRFCTSCHSMAGLAADPHFKNSAHRSNPAGVVASCSDCHIPASNWFVETYTHAAMGLKDLIAEQTGDFSEAAWKARRAALAHRVHEDMRKQDGVTCRSCHHIEAMKAGKDATRVAHALMREKQMTCVDCHFSVAHASAPPPMNVVIPQKTSTAETADLLKYYNTWVELDLPRSYSRAEGRHLHCMPCQPGQGGARRRQHLYEVSQS